MGEVFKFISEGSIAGIPSLGVMLIPLIIGLIIGFFIKKFLKMGIIIGILIAVIMYFGLFNLSFDSLKDTAVTYGPMIVHYAVVVLGMLPLSVGFVIGLVIGFIFG